MIIKQTTKFKKDLKRYKNNIGVITKLSAIIRNLVMGEDIPSFYRPHRLKGDYKDYMECHIENDVLLVWWDKETGIITLVRLGTHSELFK